MTGPQYLKSWLDAIDGDEKFILTLGAGIVNSLLRIFGFIDISAFVTLIMGTVGAFIAAKTYEDVKAKQSDERVTVAAEAPK